MEQVEVEMCTQVGNWAVLRLPGRKFPGVIMQGDSMEVLLSALRDATAAIEAGDP
jgi:hypothetical protein